jgi:hypothetical protein
VTLEMLYRSDDYAAEVWLGDCLDPESVAAVMGERKADALIVDAPYSERTHGGHAEGRITAERAGVSPVRSRTNPYAAAYARRCAARGKSRRDIVYPSWSPSDVETFVDIWSPRTDGWLASLTDHELFPHWSSSCEVNGRLGFQPLPFVETGSRVRMVGDGPSSWTCWLMVARPRTATMARWGTLPGAYIVPAERRFNSLGGSDRIVGGKPLAGMLAIVGDYSRHGDLVVDPCCGAGTTGVAARTLGRRFIGIDSNREHAEIAVRRVSEAREQITMAWVAPREEHQTTMFTAECGAKGE